LEDLADIQFEWPKSLEFLDFGATDFIDLKSLKNLPNLTHLDLRGIFLFFFYKLHRYMFPFNHNIKMNKNNYYWYLKGCMNLG
jgi:hypothetical protein